jgi:HEAT repeat protein
VGIPATAVFLALSGQSAQPGAYPDVDPAVVRRLIDALKDPDPEVRQNLAAALAKIGPPSVEPLISALKDGVPERRAGAAYALALIGPPARAALPGLLSALDDKEVEVRRQASYAISRLVPVGRPGNRIVQSPSPVGGKP